MEWILRFIPEEKRQLIVLGQRIIASLDTPAERRAAIRFGIKMLSSDSEGGSRVTITEWSRFGSRLGILKGPRSPKKSG